jgi:hypothetical protein
MFDLPPCYIQTIVPNAQYQAIVFGCQTYIDRRCFGLPVDIGKDCLKNSKYFDAKFIHSGGNAGSQLVGIIRDTAGRDGNYTRRPFDSLNLNSPLLVDAKRRSRQIGVVRDEFK